MSDISVGEALVLRRVLITGGEGQLGFELERTVPDWARVRVAGRAALDVTDPQAVEAEVADYGPQLIINAAGYTAVDRAESASDAAFAVNRDGVANLARAAAGVNARLIHVSTDFVFDGTQGRSYQPDDVPNPLSVYGASKYAGEQAAFSLLEDQALVVRTAWVYSHHGQNFVKTMLRLFGERDQLRVVCDQIGTPTWANGLARALWNAAELGLSGIHHWTDAGVASWYDFAVAIRDEALVLGLIDRSVPIEPIAAVEYPTPAKRPSFSVLDKTSTWQALGYKAEHWRESLRKMLLELARQTE